MGLSGREGGLRAWPITQNRSRKERRLDAAEEEQEHKTPTIVFEENEAALEGRLDPSGEVKRDSVKSITSPRAGKQRRDEEADLKDFQLSRTRERLPQTTANMMKKQELAQ